MSSFSTHQSKDHNQKVTSQGKNKIWSLIIVFSDFFLTFAVLKIVSNKWDDCIWSNFVVKNETSTAKNVEFGRLLI